MHFSNPVRVIEARDSAEVTDGLAAMEQALAEGLWVAGYIAYEAGFALEASLAGLHSKEPGAEPLLWLGCYREPEVCEEAELTRPAAAAPAPPMEPRLSLTADDYERRVEIVRCLIAAGDTYQANLTMDARWETEEDPAALYQRLLKAQPVPFAALLHPEPARHILSLSPELFFSRSGDSIITRPMKGTAPIGLDMAETRSNAAWLQSDEKNRAENVMIVDLLRSDLGRICRTGSVRVSHLLEVERYPTVLQMTSTVEGTLREDIGWVELFRALFPSGSIVGAPKIHTMRLLHALEDRPRGVYTGAIGYIAPDKSAEFSVAIRTLSLCEGRARMGVGSGIIYDSQPAQEYAECRTKTAFLVRAPEEDFQLIETLLLERGAYALRDEHLARISESAEYFGMPLNSARLRTALAEAAQAHGEEERIRVRILLHWTGEVTWTASALDFELPGPVDLLLRPERTDPLDPFLRHKTTRRALYDQALRDSVSTGCVDALFLNTREELTEGAIHNLVVSIQGQQSTPPLSSGVLPGVFRRHLLEEGRLTEHVLTLDDLPRAEAIFICNSVRGLRRVGRIRQRGPGGAVETLWSATTSFAAPEEDRFSSGRPGAAILF